VLVCMIFHGLNRFTVWVSRYAPCSRPECPPGYAKKLIKDRPLTHFFATPSEHPGRPHRPFNCGI